MTRWMRVNANPGRGHALVWHIAVEVAGRLVAKCSGSELLATRGPKRQPALLYVGALPPDGRPCRWCVRDRKGMDV